jgi:protein ImuB
MLWLALHFHRLPLDILERGTADSSSPVAIASSAASQATLLSCNQRAFLRGIQPGMSVTAAWALASDLRIVVHDSNAEQAALERIAAWAVQFTPVVSVSPPADILLELEGSLRLFGGLRPLYRLIENGLAALGYAARLACAPTPLAAQLFARAGLAARIQHNDALLHALVTLPVEVLEHPPEIMARLASFGVRSIGECMALPRAETARRVGQQLLDDIDRALGRLPDPRPQFAAPPTFDSCMTLPAPVEQADALLFGARRLLGELCGWLAAIGKGALRLRWMLAHEHSADTEIDIRLVTASRDAEHLVSVMSERLSRLELPSPATALALHVTDIEALASHNLSFIPEKAHSEQSATRLIERLEARLGEQAVIGLTTQADYRPERAWQRCRPGEEALKRVSHEHSSRPLWMLITPQPLRQIDDMPQYEGPLSLLAGPERIQSGWWDGDDVTRDYYVARNAAQSVFWIYRELARPRWYLHGIFG